MSSTEHRSIPGLKDVFRLDTRQGLLAIASAALVIVGAPLAYFTSNVFLLLLAGALVLSLLAMPRAGGDRPGRLASAGYAMAFNGGLLIVALFLVGFIGDFISSPRQGLRSEAVGLGFTTVHILLGIGLLLVDNYRHVSRQDI
jgi:hypothetical protein